jgi:hypothetical protein
MCRLATLPKSVCFFCSATNSYFSDPPFSFVTLLTGDVEASHLEFIFSYGSSTSRPLPKNVWRNLCNGQNLIQKMDKI